MNKQRGVVLILAMLIVVMVTTITISLSWRYNLSLTRSENRWHGMQARAYLEGAETLAAVVLREDFLEDQNSGRMVDTLTDIWAQTAEAFPTEEGWVRGKVEDAQGRFNINLMEAKAQQGAGGQQQGVPLAQRFTEPQRRFIRLLQTFEFEDGPIDPARAVEITEAVIDWIDGDQAETGFGGAEQSYYQQLNPPATPPNLPMISVSELRRIKGMTEELYTALLPVVIALPPDAKLNINTMPLRLMQTINDPNDLLPLTAADAQLLIDERDAVLTAAPGTGGGGEAGASEQSTSGFENVEAFKNSQTLPTLVADAAQLDVSDLTVRSDFFLLFSDTQVGEQIRSSASMLKRTNGQVQVVRRTDAHF